MSLRLLLAIIIIGALFYFVGLGEVVAVFREIEFIYIVYLALIGVAAIWISSLKWQLFIRSHGHQVGILHLMKLYTVGYFFNTLAPSYVAGDVARSFHLGRHVGSQHDAFVATFFERLTGLIAMCFLGTLFVLIGTSATAGLEGAILLVSGCVFGGATICFSRRLSTICFSFCVFLVRRIGFKRLAEKLQQLFAKIGIGMQSVRSNWLLLGQTMILSLAYHTLTVINVYVAALAIGWDNPDIKGLFVVVPLVLLVSIAPVTPSGLGIQEGAFLFFLKRIGGTAAQGLGVGLVLRAKIVIIAALGGFFWFWMRRQKKRHFVTGS